MAGLGYDGSILIDTKINSDGFLKELQKMGNALETQVKRSEKVLDGLTKKREQAQKSLLESQGKLGDLTNQKGIFSDQIGELERAIKKAREKVKELSKDGVPEADNPFLRKAQENLNRLVDEREKIFKEAEKTYREVEKAQNDVIKNEEKIASYDAEIAKVNQTLAQQREEYEKNSQAIEARKQQLESINQAAEVGDQRIIDLSHRLAELQARQKDLSSAGLGLGYKEFDENEKAIQSITAELKEYQKTLQNIGKATGTADEQLLQKMSDDALQAKQRIIELADEYYNLLQKQEAEPGIDFSKQIEENLRETAEKIKYINSLAKEDILGTLASGAEVARFRIEQVKQTLEDLNEQRRKSDSLSAGEIAELDKNIAAFERTMEAYQRNLDAASAGGSDSIADGAEVADQYIVDLVERLGELQNRQKELESAGFGLGHTEFDENAREIAEITAELKNYQKALQDVAVEQEKIGKFKGTLEEIRVSVSDVFKEFDAGNYAKAFDQIGKSMQTAGTQIAGTSETAGAAFSEMGGAISAAAGELSIFLAIIMVIVKAVKALLAAMQKFAQDSVRQMAGVINACKNIAKALSPLGKLFEKAFSVTKNGVAKLVKGLADATKGIAKFAAENNALTKVTDMVHSKLERLGNMIRRVFVFSVITKGLRELRSELSLYLSINDQFVSSLRTLQGVLLTAFQPIYEAVLPALITLINIVSKALAVVTAFISALFGKTATQSQKAAKALYQQAHATKEAGKAAKQAAKDAEVAIAAFDEFNILAFPDKSGGGGGADAGIEMPNFDYKYEDLPFDSWGEAFSAFLDKLLNGLPKLELAFKDFADWLNDFAKKLYDMFTFPGVLDKVKALGKGLAEALNKLVNWIDWRMLGKALGAGLNLALNFLTSFLYAFDWMNLGRKLAEFVNGLVEEIDWYEFGRLLWAGFKIALETLAGFILGLDMPLIGKAISDTIRGFFDEMYNTIQRIPWYEIGKQIATLLNSIDWYGSITVALKAISAAIEALFTMLNGFVENLHWRDIGQQIYRAINDSLGLIDWGNIGKSIGNAFYHIFDFVQTVVSGIRWHQIGENIAALILGFDFVKALSSLAMAIASAVNAAVEVACGYLDKVGPQLAAIADGIAGGLTRAINNVDWKKLGDVIGRAIKGALTFVAELLDPTMFYSIGKAIGEFLVNLDWVGLIGGLAQVLANAISSAIAGIEGMLDTLGPNLEGIATGIAQKINDFVRGVDWAKLGKTINEGINAALDFLITILDQLDWESIGQAIVDFLTNLDWGQILSKWGTVVGKAIGGALNAIDLTDMLGVGANIAGGILEGMLNKWNESGGIVGWIKRHLFSPFLEGFMSLFGIHSPSTVMAEQGGYIVAGLIKGMEDAWGGVVEFLSEKVGALKTAVQEKFGEVRDSIVKVWEDVKKDAAAKWDSIKETVSEKWNSIIDGAEKSFESVRGNVAEAWVNIKKDVPGKWEEIKGSLVQQWEKIRDTAKTKFEEVRKKVSDAWAKIKNDVPGKWNEIKSALVTAWGKIKESATSKFGEIKDSIFNKMSELKNKDWKSIGTKMVDGIQGGLNGIFTKLSTWASKVKTSISNALNGAKSAVPSGGSTVTQSARASAYSMASLPSGYDSYSQVELPRLANGAVIPPNQQFLAILGDQRSGMNVEAPLSTIEKAVQNVMDRNSGFGGDINITVESILDGKVVARNTVKHINDMTRSSGRPVLLF